MSISNICHNLLTKFAQQGLADRANFLKNIAVIGWVLSSLAQTCALVFNDKIPAKEKRFLIPQEIFDGIANATLFWFVTSKATDFGKMLVLKKKIIPQSLTKILSNYTPNGKNIAQLSKNFFQHVSLSNDPKAVSLARHVVDGMGVFTGIAGAVISNNILTPIVRNSLAGLYQKKENARINEKIYLNPAYGNIDYSKYSYTTPLLIKQNPFYEFQRPTMKI